MAISEEFIDIAENCVDYSARHRDFILGKGLKLHTPVLITNPDMVKDMKPVIGETVTAGNDTVLTYKVK